MDDEIDFHSWFWFSLFFSVWFSCSFYVDNVPIREVKRTATMGGDFPSKPMTLYATIWDGSTWATNGGKYKVNYKYAPYIAEFSDFILHGCTVDPTEQSSSCDHSQKSIPIPSGMTPSQRAKMESLRKKHLTYSYCYDRIRYKTPPSECVINPDEAERLRLFDPVTFGKGRRHRGKIHHHSHPRQAESASAWSLAFGFMWGVIFLCIDDDRYQSTDFLRVIEKKVP